MGNVAKYSNFKLRKFDNTGYAYTAIGRPLVFNVFTASYFFIIMYISHGFLIFQMKSGRYDKKEDFTVVLQPFMRAFNALDDPARRFEEVLDISYITHDCFHFSQKGHALGKSGFYM